MKHRGPNPNSIPLGEFCARYGIRPEPCPFCHRGNLWMHVSAFPHVECQNCGAEGPRPARGTYLQQLDLMRLAVELWNSRNPPELISRDI